MKIIGIFAPIKKCLLSVHYEGEDCDEFTRLMRYWNDVEYLYDFFNKNKKNLSSGFYGNTTVNEAIEITLDEVDALESLIREKAKKGRKDIANSLQTIFKPLNDNEYQITFHQKTKVKGGRWNSWLRIYAIRIAPNLFVVSGGAIKLTKKMDEAEHTSVELAKLEATRNYLSEAGILDENDYEYLEI